MKVTGIGGVFFRAQYPETLAAWYSKHLGVFGINAENDVWSQEQGQTVFMPFPADTDYFGRDTQQFMINFRVEDLDGLLAKLKSNDVKVVGEIQVQTGVGRFAHIEDPERNRIELWEPAAH